VVTIAEESTAWPKVTHPISEGGLGFTFKWNMGWMHDTLDYFKVDPFFRKGAHDKLTFAIWYEWSEQFVNPLSHDEVVHLKKSLLGRMPGDEWQQLANLRALIGYSVTRPGKSLFFMGTELGSYREWNHDVSLEWHLLEDPKRRGLLEFVAALGAMYREHSSFWRLDHDPAGYRWIDVADREKSVISYARLDGDYHAVVALNLTPVPRPSYRLGVPAAGRYELLLNSDAPEFAGSGFPVDVHYPTEAVPYHGFEQSIVVSLPPLAMLVLHVHAPERAESPDTTSVDTSGTPRKRQPKREKTPKPEKSAKAEKSPKKTTAKPAKPSSVKDKSAKKKADHS
jgi:1,4-alpha-glucan branching enzyme